MKLTAILGSPRPEGNTDILAGRVLNGARSAGLETSVFALRSLKLGPCRGCEKCWTKGRPCLLDDDMQRLYEAISETDILLLATPVYWYAPTAMMKAFIDRLVPFNRPQGRPLIRRKGALAVVAYEEEGPEAVEPLLKMLELSFRYLELDFIDRLVVDGVGPKGAVLEKPKTLDLAYQLGEKLASWQGRTEPRGK